MSAARKYRKVAYRAIVDVLREYPPLAEQVKSWRTRSGAPDEMSPVSTNMMPLIGLSPIPNPSEVMSVDHQRVNFGVSVQLFVRGTNVDDILDLWEDVEDAIRDDQPFRGTTVREYLCSCLDAEGPAGVNRLRSVTPAFSGVDYRKPPLQVTYQNAAGTLGCFFRRPNRILPINP